MINKMRKIQLTPQPQTTITPQKKKWIKPEIVVIEVNAGGSRLTDSVESNGS